MSKESNIIERMQEVSCMECEHFRSEETPCAHRQKAGACPQREVKK
jgi:hypothetical protein